MHTQTQSMSIRVDDDDPLAYLSCSPINKYSPGEQIYTYCQPSTRIYLVMDGKVKVLRRANGAEVVVDVYRPQEFFGESALAGLKPRMETAIALEHTAVMSWSKSEMEDNAVRLPKLAMALLRLLASRCADFGSRIHSLTLETIEQRLRRTLIRFAERFGDETEDGTVKMEAFTHYLLSQCVGTQREIVTSHMNKFRRDGYLDYSRNGISIRQHAFTEWQTRIPDPVAAAAAIVSSPPTSP